MNVSHKIIRGYKRITNIFTRQVFRLASKKRIKQLLVSGKPIFLELGAGPRKGINGWVTSDIGVGPELMIDLLEPFPFPNKSIDMLYSSHVLEHFSTRQLENILKECRRVLKREGVISRQPLEGLG